MLSYAVLPGVSDSDSQELGRKDPRLRHPHPRGAPGSQALWRAAATRAQAQRSSFGTPGETGLREAGCACWGRSETRGGEEVLQEQPRDLRIT